MSLLGIFGGSCGLAVRGRVWNRNERFRAVPQVGFSYVDLQTQSGLSQCQIFVTAVNTLYILDGEIYQIWAPNEVLVGALVFPETLMALFR